ncbi:PD-(D/E)XK nuclease family protein, partial [Bacteroidales bacterium AH-315-N07]|nr:PD-(D/E)XK nuclease family protein [Bacteroidales bacterium AH-315-N07]
VIDYKTGNIKGGELSIGNIIDLRSNSNKSKTFQLFMYAYMYSQMNPEIKNLESGIISFRSLSKGLHQPKVNKKGIIYWAELLAEFEEVLKDIFSEMFDRNIPFSQVEDESHCIYCPFTGVCGR